MRRYTPRRANKQRWLAGAPEYVLDCFYYPAYDSYDVLFTGSLLGTVQGKRDFANTYIMGLDVSTNGAWSSFELEAYQAHAYRYRNGKKRVKWNELPEAVRVSVQNWAETDEAA